MHGQRRAGLLIRPRNFESPSERAWVRGKEHSKGSGTLTEGSGVLSLCLIAVERVETRERAKERSGDETWSRREAEVGKRPAC